MKTKSGYTLLLLFVLSIRLFYGQSLVDTLVLDYSNINKTISEKMLKNGTQNVLVVMDIDNTILTSDTDLGSNILYQWQRNELNLKPTPEQKLTDSCLFTETIGLLYKPGTMGLTDNLLPAYITNWQNKGVTDLNSNNIDIVLFHYSKIMSEKLKNNNKVVITMEQAERVDQIPDMLTRSLKNNTIKP